MAGDPKNQDPLQFGQKLFGGTLKMEVIDTKSQLIQFVTDLESWQDEFSDRLLVKFPYLISV